MHLATGEQCSGKLTAKQYVVKTAYQSVTIPAGQTKVYLRVKKNNNYAWGTYALAVSATATVRAATKRRLVS